MFVLYCSLNQRFLLYSKYIAKTSLTTGPIIRVTPDEIKIKDIEYYDSLYSISQPRDKYGPSAKMAGTPLSGRHPPTKRYYTPI